MMVAGIPSMHICLDFIPELLNQPRTEKQVRYITQHARREENSQQEMLTSGFSFASFTKLPLIRFVSDKGCMYTIA